MMRKKNLAIILACIVLGTSLIIIESAYCGNQGADYLCDAGIYFYRNARYQEALHEFNKALLIEPNNKKAQKYIDIIAKKQKLAEEKTAKSVADQPATKPAKESIDKSRGRLISQELNLYSKAKQGTTQQQVKKSAQKESLSGVSGAKQKSAQQPTAKSTRKSAKASSMQAISQQSTVSSVAQPTAKAGSQKQPIAQSQAITQAAAQTATSLKSKKRPIVIDKTLAATLANLNKREQSKEQTLERARKKKAPEQKLETKITDKGTPQLPPVVVSGKSQSESPVESAAQNTAETQPTAVSENLQTKSQTEPEVDNSKHDVKPVVIPGKSEKKSEKKTAEEGKPKKSPVKISGEAQVAIGISSPNDFLWDQANADLSERNWRVLSDSGLNRRSDTYDRRIFDRLRVNIDTEKKEGFDFHGNICVDPWSFTGKSSNMTLSGANANADTANLQILSWGNTNYTVNQTIYTLLRGDSLGLPEMKIDDGETPSTNITSTNGNIFTIPSSKLEYQFQPLRELWVEYTQPEIFKLRVFPIAYQDQALTSNDPLRLSNNHIWWEESPWLDRWRHGNFNSPLGDFGKGEWDDALSFFTRDSDGTRLTALRGASFNFEPGDNTKFDATFASPKGLWQNYSSYDNFVSATQVKHYLFENLTLGGIYTYRLGLNEDNNDKKDMVNHVVGADVGYEVIEGFKLATEVAQSFNKQDMTSPAYESRASGNAYYISLVGTFPKKSIMDLQYGYDEIKPKENQKGSFAKMRLYGARMDQGFLPALSTYRETRDDLFWSRHIQFREPMHYYYTGLYNPTLKWEDIAPYRIGNGIDSGRDVIGLRVETSMFDRGVDNLFDVRNVHETNGKFIENVARDEVTYKVNDRLTTKLLGIYQVMPHTKGGLDPFVVDGDTGSYLRNSAIPDGADPSLKTGSLGLQYKFFDWLSVDGVWERTNDYNVGYDNFPRGNLTGSTFDTYTSYGNLYRADQTFLYSQGLFPLPPYDYYNIFKTGFNLKPLKNLDIYLDYTRNFYKSAGQIDDNMNHIGLETSYLFNKKLGMYFKYVFSRWNDVSLMQQGYNKYYLSHHNFFTEFRYLRSPDDEFILQYGEGGHSPIAVTSFDPFGTSLSTLDTEHIIRLYYRRNF